MSFASRPYPTADQLATIAPESTEVDLDFKRAHDELDKLTEAVAAFLIDYPFLLTKGEASAIKGIVSMIEHMRTRETETLDAAIKLCLERARANGKVAK